MCQAPAELFLPTAYNNARSAQGYINELEGDVVTNCAIIQELQQDAP